MLETITYKRNMPDTVHGHSLTITKVYTSFDQAEIDTMEDWAKEMIGAGIVRVLDVPVRKEPHDAE